MSKKSHVITGACLSQFSDNPNEFEFLVAYSDGREIGYSMCKEVAGRIADEMTCQLEVFREEPKEMPKKDFSWLSNMSEGELEDAIAFLTVDDREALRGFVNGKTTKDKHAKTACDTPAPMPNVNGGELLTTIKEFARWHHLNEMTIAAGKTPSDSEIDFEAISWNRITRAISPIEEGIKN